MHSLNFGDIMSRATSLMRDDAKAVAIAVLALTVAGVVLDAAGSASTIVYAFLSLGFQAWITQKLVKTLNLSAGHEPRKNYIGAMFGMSILTGLAILLGFVALVVPGIILAVRWSLSVPALFTAPLTVTEAMRKSWDMTKGNFWAVFLSLLIAYTPMILAILVLLAPLITGSAADLDAQPTTLASVVSNALLALAPVASWYVAVAIYEFLAEPGATLQDIFS